MLITSCLFGVSTWNKHLEWIYYFYSSAQSCTLDRKWIPTFLYVRLTPAPYLFLSVQKKSLSWTLSSSTKLYVKPLSMLQSCSAFSWRTHLQQCSLVGNVPWFVPCVWSLKNPRRSDSVPLPIRAALLRDRGGVPYFQVIAASWPALALPLGKITATKDWRG